MTKKIEWAVLLSLSVLIAILEVISGQSISYWQLTIISLPFILYCFHYRFSMRPSWRKLFLGLMLILVLVSAHRHVGKVNYWIRHPHEWDFMDFWIAGQTATKGLNVYDPNDYRKIELPFTPSQEFKEEVLDVGLKYPPPSIFLFLPLGLLTFKKALAFWYLMQLSFLAISMVLLWRIFSRVRDLTGLALTMVLVMSSKATFNTFLFAQTNFIALSMFLLFWLYRGRIVGGIWLCLGMLVKPFLGIFVLYLLMKRQWPTLLSALASLMICSFLSLILMGKTPFVTYFLSNPSGGFPEWVYTEGMNQSLLSTILRFTDYQFTGKSPISHPIFVAVAFMLTAATGFVVNRLDDADHDWGLGLTLILALLIYPSSMQYYAVMLLVPTMLLWSNKERIPHLSWIGVIGFITMEYYLMHAYNGETIFFATAAFWSLFFYIGFAQSLLHRKKPQ